MDNFAEYIRKTRVDKGLKLRDAATRIGISAPYLSRIENGLDKPPIEEKLKKMAEVYGVEENELISNANERAAQIYGDQIMENAALHVFLRMVKDLGEGELVDIIRSICTEKGWDPQKFLDEIEKRKKELPRLEKERDWLFAAQVPPARLSRQRIEGMATSFLARHGVTPENYSPPTPIEQLIEKEEDIRFFINDKMSSRQLGMSHWSRSKDGIKEIHINALLNDEDDPTAISRLCFTAGHELFHCLEHLPLLDPALRPVDAFERAVLDVETEVQARLTSPIVKKTLEEKWIESHHRNTLFSDEDWREWQANCFAGCVLMPHWSVREEFEKRTGHATILVESEVDQRRLSLQISKETIFESAFYDKPLNQLYEVSAKAMAIRLMELGLVRPR